MHVAERRPHQVERGAILAMPVREHGLANRQRDIADDALHRPLACGERAHPVQHAPRRRLASGRRERHHPVRQA